MDGSVPPLIRFGGFDKTVPSVTYYTGNNTGTFLQGTPHWVSDLYMLSLGGLKLAMPTTIVALEPYVANI